MKLCSGLLIVCSVCLAEPPVPHPPIPPPQLPVRQYSAWRSIQVPLARGRGEVLDESIVTTPYFTPGGRLPIEPLPDALDVKTQSFPRPRLLTLGSDAARSAELDRREYELFLHAGLNDQSLAAAADSEALNAARSQRDHALFAVQETYQARLAQPQVDRVAANNALIEQSRAIQHQYRLRRANILGDRPTTAPSP